MKNTGKEYEEFVRKLQQAILDSEKITNQKNIIVEKNKIIKDKNGIDREFDLYWEYELGGFTYKTVIECKDHESAITIDKIDALIGKTLDIPELKPVFATRVGYQSGAVEKAKQHGIDLLIVRKQEDYDWQDGYGNHLLNEIHITGSITMPARITSFQPMIDEKWIKEHRLDIDVSKPLKLCGPNNEIFIEDKDKKEKYSLYDLANRLTSLGNNEPGDYGRTKYFSDAYILYKDIKAKIISYKVLYCIPKPIENIIDINFSHELLGVVKHINTGVEKKIFEQWHCLS